MSKTPLIQSPSVNGGTLYAFSSASRDLSKAFGNNNLRFSFSKIVALDIPNMESLDFNFGQRENYMQFDAIDGNIWTGTAVDKNIALAESLQNYALNFESLILSNPEYDSDNKHTVAERVFFKWLKETGGIRFRDASGMEVASGLTRFVEEDTKLEGNTRYNKVVKYIGDIDIVNPVDKAGETYTELYIHIPTNAGNTPVVLFNSLSDNNYKPDLVLTGSDEYVNGRNQSSIHPDGLSLSAFYDYDNPIDGYTDANANWHGQGSLSGQTNSYFTDPKSKYSIAENVDIKKYPADYPSQPLFDGSAYRRSTLDGISIDFNSNNYNDIVTSPYIDSISQYNTSDKSGNFDFNAVLIYYDFYDESNPTDKATNLYGILFIDNVTPTTTNGGYIKRFNKYKPNKVINQTGNSYGLTVNLNFDASLSRSGVGTIINDYSTFSMGQFVDATVQLQKAATQFETANKEFEELKLKVLDIENRSYMINSIYTINDKLAQLEKNIQDAQLAFKDSNTLLDLIGSNSDEIQNIINGKLSVQMQYNTDVLSANNGIYIDKSVPNKISISNTVNGYSIAQPRLFVLNDYTKGDFIDSNNKLNFSVHSTPEVIFELKPFTNMCRIHTINKSNNKLKIYIDETSTPFTEGQSMRLVFPEDLDLNGHDIEIYTDVYNKFNFGKLKLLIGTINNDMLMSNKPIIEITCLNTNTYKFGIDLVR